MSLARLPDWTERHIAFIAERLNVPFAWGRQDCCILLADQVMAITGTDPAKRWRGYTTERGALSRVKKAGGMRSLARLAGLGEKHIGLAQRGDGVLANMEGRETFGIVVGDGRWCAPGADGLLFRPMAEAIVVYQV